MGDWWRRSIIEPGKLPLLLCLIAFIVTFLITRAITRLIRSGRGPFSNNISASGIHVHHAVPGLVLLVAGALAGISTDVSPWTEMAAVAVGIGASLVLDEFALILHLDDVYWSNEGQASVQAVALTTMSLTAWVLGLSPFGVNDVSRTELALRHTGIGVAVLTVVAVVVCAMKGKYRLGLLAVFVPAVAAVGAIRLARPGSRWFVKRYAGDIAKQERATARTERFDGRWHPLFRRLGDAVAGAPSAGPPPVTAA